LTCPSPTTSTISVASAIKDLISARAESSIHSPVRMDPAGIESGKQVYTRTTSGLKAIRANCRILIHRSMEVKLYWILWHGLGLCFYFRNTTLFFCSWQPEGKAWLANYTYCKLFLSWLKSNDWNCRLISTPERQISY
jgi:hypothetical protein